MMLVIRTQIHENYAWNEDGTIGTGPQAYWKAKGGTEYKILNVPANVDYDEIVAMANVERANDYVLESIIDWSIEPDDYLSGFEQSQLAYDGSIECPEPETDYSDLVQRSAEMVD